MANLFSTVSPASQEAFLLAANAAGLVGDEVVMAAYVAGLVGVDSNDAADARELALYRADRAYDAAHDGYGEAC